MSKISILKSIRTAIAKQNPRKPKKPFGHRVAELVFDGEENGEVVRENTWIDPECENSEKWTAIIDAFHRHRPCSIAVEGLVYQDRKRRLIDADSDPRIVAIFDDEDRNILNPKPNPQDLFEFQTK